MLPYAYYLSALFGFSDQLFSNSQSKKNLFQNFSIMRTFEGLHRIDLFKCGGTNKNFPFFSFLFCFFFSFSFTLFIYLFFSFKESGQSISCIGKVEIWNTQIEKVNSDIWLFDIFFLYFFFFFLESLSHSSISCMHDYNKFITI